MSIIAEYKALEAQIAEQQARLEALKNNQKLQKEIEFEPPQAVERLKMKLKKPKVKVKQSSKPKPNRIVTKNVRSTMPNIDLPEMPGFSAGIHPLRERQPRLYRSG